MADTPQDVYTTIENAIAILQSQAAGERGPAHRSLVLAVDTLKAAKAALQERDAELELVTAPDLKAAEEAQRLRHDKEELQVRIAGLEQELAMLRQEHEIEEHLHAEDAKRLKQLEKKARDFDDILVKDKEAFSAFMEKALDDEDRKRRGRGSRR